MREHPPTLKSIAESVGVTANTVSLALRNSPLVAKDTKLRIQTVAREMGYVQNAIAGSLRSGRTNTLAIVMGDVANPIFAAKIKALERVFRERGYQLMIFNSDEAADKELEAVRTAISRKVDGLVLCPCAKPEGALKLLRQHGIPCLLSGRTGSSNEQDTVLWNDKRGGVMAVNHLLKCGCKRIAWLGVTQRISSARDRKLGYIEALEAARIMPDPDLIVEANPTGGNVGEMLTPLLEKGIDGICSFSDIIAWEAVCYLEKKGYRIPEDIQITGFDAVASYLPIPYRLTSISANLHQEAETVADILLGRIQDPSQPTTIRMIETKLVLGKTTNNS